nr:MAG TPA: hypothetical protein [Crassvirales sp.]
MKHSTNIERKHRERTFKTYSFLHSFIVFKA